jgi:hypothetical protein
MKYVVGFFRFWYDFIVGDDWTIAVVVIIAVGATAALAQVTSAAWVVLPLAVAAVLAFSVWRVGRVTRSG